MSTGKMLLKELYVGFLLFLLSFLYLSHLNEKPENPDTAEQKIEISTKANVSKG